jgi:hypothetical protein
MWEGVLAWVVHRVLDNIFVESGLMGAGLVTGMVFCFILLLVLIRVLKLKSGQGKKHLILEHPLPSLAVFLLSGLFVGLVSWLFIYFGMRADARSAQATHKGRTVDAEISANPKADAAPQSAPDSEWKDLVKRQRESARRADERRLDEEAAKRISEIGTRPAKAPTFTESEEYFVTIGGFTFSLEPGVPTDLLGGESQNEIGMFGKELMVRGTVIDEKVKVTARLFAGPGAQPVEIVNNEVKVPSWDTNYNESALEIVNEDLEPVLQIIYTRPRSVNITGVFSGYENRTFRVTPHGSVTLPPNAPVDPRLQLKRLFKYPSRKYPGQEIDVKPLFSL